MCLKCISSNLTPFKTMFLIFFVGTPQEIPKIFHTFDHLLGLCRLHGDDLSPSLLLGDVLGHLLGDSLSRHLGDSLLGLCRLLSHLLGDSLGRLLGDGLGCLLGDALSHSYLLGAGLSHLLGDSLGHQLLSDGPGHLLGDALVSSCLLSSSSSCRFSPRLTAILCRSPPPPQSWPALGLGVAVTRGRGVPELCPHLANFHVECQVWA